MAASSKDGAVFVKIPTVPRPRAEYIAAEKRRNEQSRAKSASHASGGSSSAAAPSSRFFCEWAFICWALPLSVLGGFVLYLVAIPLLAAAGLFALPALCFAYLYISHFMPLHDWAEKIPVLFIKYFNFERSLWPQPRFEAMNSSRASVSVLLGERYQLQPRRVLDKCNVDYSIPASRGRVVALPLLSDAEYVNLRALRLGVWKGIGTAMVEATLSLMRWMPDTSLAPGGYLRRYGDAIRFGEGESAVDYVMGVLGASYPTFPDEWADRTSDEALTRMCLHGLGPHRLERTGRGYVVKTNALASFDVAEGFERYGGDVHLDEQFRPVRIVRLEKSEGGRGGLVEVEYLPGCEGWEYVKYCFRCSLFTLVTIVDHLYGVHLQWANGMVVACREQLGADHPVRRFLTPYYFGTIQVNHIARHLLVAQGSLGARNFAFSDEGLRAAWQAVPEVMVDGAELRGELGDAELLRLLFDVPEYCARREGELGLRLPYYEQAEAYWRVVHRLVSDYFDLWFPTPEEAAADAELRCWLEALVGELVHTAPLLPALRGFGQAELRAFAIDAVTRCVFEVTAHHEHYGGVAVYAQDVRFCSFAWPVGEQCGTKITAVTQATLMAATSFPMPPLLNRKPGLDAFSLDSFLRAPSDEAMPRLEEACRRFEEGTLSLVRRCDEFVAQADRRPAPWNHGLWSFNPRYFEASVSV